MIFCIISFWTGDNFYFTGVENEDSTRFIKTFEDVYTSASLQIPWYVIAGNHDHYGNVTGQIDYTRHSNLWKFPNFYHSHEFIIPGTSMSVQIILIDTVLLCGHSGHDHHPKPLTGIVTGYLRLIFPSFGRCINGGNWGTRGTCCLHFPHFLCKCSFTTCKVSLFWL